MWKSNFPDECHLYTKWLLCSSQHNLCVIILRDFYINVFRSDICVLYFRNKLVSGYLGAIVITACPWMFRDHDTIEFQSKCWMCFYNVDYVELSACRCRYYFLRNCQNIRVQIGLLIMMCKGMTQIKIMTIQKGKPIQEGFYDSIILQYALINCIGFHCHYLSRCFADTK